MKLLNKINNKLYAFNNYFLNAYNHKYIFAFACIYATFLLLIPGIPRGHDLTFHLSRIEAIKEGLILGDFPIRIYPLYLNDYGYANGIFYPDLFLYIPAIFCILGLNVIVSYKLFILICTICTAISMYWCVKEIFKSKNAAIISMFLYTLSSYRIADVYIRAALGEVLAFIFLPIVILGVYKIVYSDYRKWYILTIGFTGLLLSHIISSELAFIYIAIIIVVNIKRLVKEKKRIIYLAIATAATILLSAFFLFPMLEQMISGKFIFNTQISSNEVWNTTLPILKIIFEIPYPVLFMSGISGIGIVFFIILFLRVKVKIKDNDKFINLCIIMGILSLVCVTKAFPWKFILKYIEALSVIQFSWRLYLFATLFLSIVAGKIVLLYNSTKKYNKVIISLILVLSIFSCSINMFSQYIFYGYSKYKGFYELDLSKYSIGLGEYLPEGVNKKTIETRGEIIESNSKDIEYTFFREGTTLNIKFNNNIYDGCYLEVPLLYYLGYEAEYIKDSNKTVLPITRGKNGVVKIDLLNYQEGNIIIKYKGTKVQNISGFISIISLILFILIVIRDYKISRRRKYENEKIIYNNTYV